MAPGALWSRTTFRGGIGQAMNRPHPPVAGREQRFTEGCGPGHPTGLHVRCFKTAEGVISPIIIPGQYSGPPGAAHGGIVAAYLDEVLAAAVIRAAARTAVTGELTVRYLKPVPVETPIVGKGSLVADHGRYVDVEGCLEDLGTGTLLASARARFFPIPS